MVYGEFVCWEVLAAVLAEVAVSCEEVSSVEFDGCCWEFVVAVETDDARYGDVEADGAYPVVFFWLELSSCLAEFCPCCEVVVCVRAVVDADDLCELLAEEREGPAGVDDADGDVEAVEDQDLAGEGCVEVGEGLACWGDGVWVGEGVERSAPAAAAAGWVECVGGGGGGGGGGRPPARFLSERSAFRC